MSKTLKYILTTIVTAALLSAAFAGGFVFGHVTGKSKAVAVVDAPPSLALIQEAKRIIGKLYIGKTADRKLEKAAITGMVESLDDPYSEYIDPKQYKSFQEHTTGEFSGVGVTLELRKKQVTVVEPIPNTPAARAGVRADDVIVQIDGVSAVRMPLVQASAKIRGPKGTKVSLKIKRPGTGKLLTFNLIRAAISLPNVFEKVLASGLGYVRFHSFTENSGSAVEKAVKRLAAKGVKGVIIDLRDNPGGLVNASVDVGSIFVPSGPIVLMKGRGDETETINAVEGGYHTKMKVVVLVNKNSASASEIFAGAIQDRDRGLIVGTRTFGKASVQTVEPLSNGGAIKITSAHYLTPDGKSISKVGIKPDIIAEASSKTWMLDGKDSQKTKAIQVLRLLIAGRLRP